MNRLPLIAIVSTMFAFAALGQETATRRGSAQDSLPAVKEQMKVLSQKLDLTPEQRVKIKPIVQQLNKTTLTIMEDRNLSHDERLAKVRPHRLLADKKIRETLSAEQNKKLDAYEAGPHPEMHGTLTGTPKP